MNGTRSRKNQVLTAEAEWDCKVSTQLCFNSLGDWLAQDSSQLATPMGGFGVPIRHMGKHAFHIFVARKPETPARKPETREEATKERVRRRAKGRA